MRAAASHSRRAAWRPRWEVPSVPRTRRWIHSPALVSEAEDTPPTPTLCLPFREQTEAGTLWSLLSTVGSSPCPEPAVSHARAPGGPEVLPPAGLLVSRALEGQRREFSVSKLSVRITVVDRRQRSTVSTQNPLQPSFFIFPPLHSGSPHPGSSLSPFMIKSLGKKA